MNIYQKIAFGVVAVLALALLAQDNLIMLIALAAIVALLTLPTTWKLIFSVLQMVGFLLGGIGHGIGWVGDVIVDWSELRKSNLASPVKKASNVPDWGSSELQVPTLTAEPSEELDVPAFLKDDKRGDDAGLGIFEPADN